ncbi:hypothetical protein ABL78_2570 [Leptomonas seymouri]|uniref:Histone RNA hairpin-binding protein RNA-binding domain-containing protein n=1 Tax=Leptomonas seymouri TaxID=5684 RepID=A0A0N1I7C9_LEPSE|nr:hypothetical protein ABL78_2570 [Leptomonas seymouri]|eukprot:KPI88331.1 hypothetical protein ABL78_2570 [Leptomonas seymouri]
MERDFQTPLRAPRSTAAPSASGAAQTPDQLGLLREGSQTRSPAPRFPTLPSPSAAHRSSNACRATPSSSQACHVQQSPQQQQQQGSCRNRSRHSHCEASDAFNVRSSRNSGGAAVQKSCEPSWRQQSALASGTSPSQGSRARKASPSGNSPDEDRRRSQRDKQIHFGYATDGYVNMERLIRHDPLLRSGGLLPLSPPTVSKGSKRIWDIQLRKWRRALHMFDYVFIDGEDDPATRAGVLEEQRQQWVSEAFQGAPRDMRKRLSLDALRSVQRDPAVPTKIPVEDDLRCILRSEDCYESVRSVVPQSASSLTKGTDISPLEAGIKIHIAPSSAVLQRQQAQQELQQRLTALQQQQQQSPSQPQPQSELPFDAVLNKTPQRHTSPPPTVAAHRSEPSPSCRTEAPSPSPRRPLLSLEASPPVVSAAASEKQPQQVRQFPPPQQQHPSASHRVSISPCPTVVLPTEAAAVVAPQHGSCGTAVLLSPSPASAATAMMSDTASLSTSQPVPFSSSTSSPGRLLGQRGSSAGEVQMSPSPPMAPVLLPPPPFPGATPQPNAFASSSAGMMGTFASSHFVGPAGFTSMYASMPWCEAPGTSAVRLNGVVYGLPHNASAVGGAGVMQPCVAPGAPWVPQHIFADPSAIRMPVLMASAMPIMPSSAGPISAATITSHVESSSSGRPPGPLQSPSTHSQQSTNRSPQHTVYASSLERATEPHTPSAALAHGGPRRSGGGGGCHSVGAATPKTIPRFVARLSTSPSEQRLGTQPQHRGDRGKRTPSIHKPESLHTAAKEPKSQSLSHLTPERSLFGAATATADANTEARPVQLRGESVEGDDGVTAGKRPAEGDSEGRAVAPLNFHTDAA